MILTTTSVRAGGPLCGGILALTALASLTACAPATPEPTPAETALFASDEEAFAAAEKTYRAYTDAVNAVDLGDPESVEPVYEFLANPAEAASRKNYSTYYAESIVRTGVTQFDTFTPVSYNSDLVTARVCLDISDVNLLNVDGKSIVPPERVDRQPLELEMIEGDSPTGLVIRSNILAEDFAC